LVFYSVNRVRQSTAAWLPLFAAALPPLHPSFHNARPDSLGSFPTSRPQCFLFHFAHFMRHALPRTFVNVRAEDSRGSEQRASNCAAVTRGQQCLHLADGPLRLV